MLTGIRSGGLLAAVLSTWLIAAPTVAIADPAVTAEKQPEELLIDGMDAMAAGKSAEARDIYRRLRSQFPGSEAAAAAARELGKFPELARSRSAVSGAKARDGDGPMQLEVTAVDRRIQHAFVVDVGDRVFFAENSAQIGGRARSIIESQARWLLARPDLTGMLIGRADDSQSDSQDMALSNRRAEAVQSRLIEAGVPAQRLQIMARGRGEPIATCATTLCQAQNRHVELLVRRTAETTGAVNADQFIEFDDDGDRPRAAVAIDR